MPEKTCEICSRKISLSEHPLGLVFEDNVFICEECCDNHSREELTGKLNKTVMQPTINGMPIAVWLIHEQNKDKTMMTVKK
jgi:hypothetical protein